jgi:predicted NUDIX family phosphoesterase
MPATNDEQILVIPADVIAEIGRLEGFEPDVGRFLDPILASERLAFRPRAEMETDPRYKQLIPYVLLQWTDPSGEAMLFTYTRGGGSGESRLHAKRSVGIGGHISLEDASDGSDPYTTGMHREVDEEVEIGSPYRESREGLLYDPSNDVGRVHVGIVHRFELEQPRVRSREADLADAGFISVSELMQDLDRLETWSRLAIEALHGAGRPG